MVGSPTINYPDIIRERYKFTSEVRCHGSVDINRCLALLSMLNLLSKLRNHFSQRSKFVRDRVGSRGLISGWSFDLGTPIRSGALYRIRFVLVKITGREAMENIAFLLKCPGFWQWVQNGRIFLLREKFEGWEEVAAMSKKPKDLFLVLKFGVIGGSLTSAREMRSKLIDLVPYSPKLGEIGSDRFVSL
uniref:Uncharacterized protein n=1 Tax=Cannabis sativa TaxID=3483 RepID=A0A803PSP9_CANSA